jgi:hypothetical protein
MEESSTLHTLECLVANDIFSRKALDRESLKRNMMKGCYLVILPQARHIEFGIALVVPWKKFIMLSLMKPKDRKMKLKILMM